MRQQSRQSCKGAKKNLVLQVIQDSEVALAPKQVYDKIRSEVNIKPSTVRNYLRDLLGDELILQPYPGYYCNRLTYSVIAGPLVVHDVHYKIFAPFLRRLDKFGDVEELTGGVKLFVQFGRQNKYISGFISNTVPGMSEDTLLFALNKILDIIERETGFVVTEGFTLTTFETNKDYSGKRLDGDISCLTMTQLFDVIQRIYQKDDDTVRGELRVSSDWKVEEAVSMLRNDLPDVNVSMGLFVVKQRIEALTLRTQFWNSELVEINKRSDFLATDLKGRVDDLTENLIKLTELLQGAINGPKGPVVSGGNPFSS